MDFSIESVAPKPLLALKNEFGVNWYEEADVDDANWRIVTQPNNTTGEYVTFVLCVSYYLSLRCIYMTVMSE